MKRSGEPKPNVAGGCYREVTGRVILFHSEQKISERESEFAGKLAFSLGK
jgi:hypothetical protein